MKLTKHLLEKMIREAVKQYAVDPDQWMTQGPLEPGYQKLKALAQSGDVENVNMAKELGYTPEIEGEEIVFTEEPIMAWIVDNYLNQPESDEVDYPKIKNTIIDFCLAAKNVLFKPRPGDPYGKEFLQFEQGLCQPIRYLYEKNKDKSPEQIIKKMAPIIAKYKKEQPEKYYNNLLGIFKGASK